MEVFAYCAKQFERSAQKASGVKPLTCPPVDSTYLEAFPHYLEGNDFIYFDLHGRPGAPYWLGDDGHFALNARQLGKIDLSGAVVFATNCYLGNDDSPMLDALLAAGAKYVIAGSGPNFAPARSLAFGAGLLGLWVRRFLTLGMGVSTALSLAKKRVGLTGIVNKQVARDTVDFHLFTRRT